jgi:uncharacterized cupredoxin-like copper-binding protein
MSGFGVARRLAAVVVVAGVLAGCTAATSPAGSGMMGGPPVAQTDPTGAPMMGGAAGYAFSRLTCAAPASLPGTTVEVMLGDMGMTQMMGGTAPLGGHMMLRVTPATVPAGQVSLVVSNMGWRTHELVVLPLAAGGSAGQRVPGADGKVEETGSLGEVSNSCAAGAGDGITAGAVGWSTVTLPPGNYELVCNLENHYANGMYQALMVS